VLLFCKHYLIIPKQYSDWLISIIKVWRKIGWSSIPSKFLIKDFFDRCHSQSFIKKTLSKLKLW
jgi:hypothetical protein